MVQVTTLCWIFKSCFANLSALVSQMVKYMPAVQETKVGSLDSEDLLEKEMATHSSILAWRIPWTEDPGGVAKSQTQRSETNTCKLSWTFTVWNIFFSKSLSCELPPQLFPTFLFFKPFNSIIPLFLARDLSRFFEVQGFFFTVNSLKPLLSFFKLSVPEPIFSSQRSRRPSLQRLIPSPKFSTCRSSLFHQFLGFVLLTWLPSWQNPTFFPNPTGH